MALLISFFVHHFADDAGGSGYYLAEAFGGEDVAAFHVIAAIYAAGWLLPLLQLPLPLPGYEHYWGATAPQWTTRPSLSAAALYVPFWLVVFAMKWAFEYYGVVQPLALPVTALWQASYRCWESGHTGTQPCAWSPSDPEALRVFRDWAIRLIVVALRSSVPLLLALEAEPSAGQEGASAGGCAGGALSAA